jgi:hypothetical protein
MSHGRSGPPNQPPAAARPAGAPGAPDDTAAGVLRLIEAQRGHLFSEKEYAQQRRTILVELAEGARLRPFTWFTFTVVELGLAAFLLIGLIAGRSGDYTLAWISFVALLCAAGVFYQFYLGVCRDRRRSLPERLKELEEVRSLQLITAEEHHEIHAQILSARQYGERIRG